MGIILVYDCTEETTFNNISNWLNQIEQHAVPNVKKVLVANKTDVSPNEIKINSERG
jgi:GTPase SAR1 family protein